MKKTALLAAALCLQMTAACAPSVYAELPQTGKNAAKQTGDAEKLKARLGIPDDLAYCDVTSADDIYPDAYLYRWSRHDIFLNPSGADYEAIVSDGRLVYYRSCYYDSRSSGPALTAVSLDTFVLNAQNWLDRVFPDMKGRLRLASDDEAKKTDPAPGVNDLSLFSDTVSLVFIRCENDIPVSDEYAEITLDKQSGEVTACRAQLSGGIFPKNTSLLTEEQIKDTAAKTYTMKPWYVINGGKVSVVYSPVNASAFDASDGRSVEFEFPDNYTAPEPYERAMTEKELKSVISEEKIKDILKNDPYIKTDDSFTYEFYKPVMRGGEGELTVTIMENKEEYPLTYSVTVDAVTGRVKGFFSSENECTGHISDTAAVKTANEAAEYYFPEEYGHLIPCEKLITSDKGSRTVQLCRYENYIQVKKEGISVTVAQDGRVTGIACNFTKNADFGDGKILSPENAAKRLAKLSAFELKYIFSGDDKTARLVYVPSDIYLNGKTGSLCDVYGSTESTDRPPVTCPYTDIADLDCRDEIELLYNNGIRPFGGGDRLYPKKAVSMEELNTMIGYVAGYEPLSEGEGKKTASRSDLARLICERADIRVREDIPNIFTDIADDDPRLGYILTGAALCGIDIREGRFDPDGIVTRGELYTFIYNYLMNRELFTADSSRPVKEVIME